MSRSEEAFQQALDRLEEAEQRLMFASAAAWDIDDRMVGDQTPKLQTLLDGIYAARRSLSQAAGWIDATIDYLDREQAYDDAGVGAECEGEGPALPDA